MVESTVRRTRGRPRGRTVGTPLVVRIPDELRAELERYVEEEDRPAAGVVRQALRQYFDRNPSQRDEEVSAEAS